MRYSMQAKIIPGKAAALKRSISDGSFSRGFPYGDLGESLRSAKVTEDGTLRWVETCYCREYSNVAMVEELPFFEKYLHEIRVNDARDPRFCDGYPHCSDCNCTDSIRFPGVSFDEYLEQLIDSEKNTSTRVSPEPTRWTGWQGVVQTEDEAARNSANS